MDFLFNNPCNLFVAGFIGTPQMNFINGTIVKTEAGYSAEFAGHRVALPESKQEKVAPYAGKEVVFGIRPEDIAVRNDGGESEEVKIDLVELMGSEMYLHCSFCDCKLTVRTPVIDGCRTDSVLPMAFNANKLHIFDKETEAVVCN